MFSLGMTLQALCAAESKTCMASTKDSPFITIFVPLLQCALRILLIHEVVTHLTHEDFIPSCCIVQVGTTIEPSCTRLLRSTTTPQASSFPERRFVLIHPFTLFGGERSCRRRWFGERFLVGPNSRHVKRILPISTKKFPFLHPSAQVVRNVRGGTFELKANSFPIFQIEVAFLCFILIATIRPTHTSCRTARSGSSVGNLRSLLLFPRGHYEACNLSHMVKDRFRYG